MTRFPFVERFVIRRYDSTVLWPTAWRFSANCLIGLSLITSSGRSIRSRSGSSRIRPEVVSSVPPMRPSYGRSSQRTKRSPPLSRSSCGSVRDHLPEVARRARPGRDVGAPTGAHAVRAEVVERLLLGRVEVARRDDLRPAARERQEQRDGLRLEVDPGADPEARERLRPVELLADLREQPAAAIT